jgi:transglutaminase-like putative cysteine protease
MPARTRPAALTADALHWPAFLATTLALVAAVALHVRWLPPALLAVFAAIVGLRVWMRWRGAGRVSAWLRILLVVALVGGVATTLGSIFGREAGSALLGAMLVTKLVEAERRRDAWVILSVAAFLVMAGFLFDQGMLQVVLATLACLLMLAAMYELDPPVGAAAGHAPLRAFTAHGLREAARHLALAVPFAIACFLLFPRLSSPMWGAPQDAYTGRTGISDRMEPGALSSLALDDAVAMRVRFDGAAPPPEQRYWRGLVFWRFDGRAWSGPDLLAGFGGDVQIAVGGPRYDYEVTLEPTDQQWLFVLDAPIAAPTSASLTRDFQARSDTPVTRVTRYRGSASTSYRMQTELERGQRYLGTSLPPDGNPRARALAESWRQASGGDPRAIARSALDLFNRGFSYSFEVPLLGVDPIDDFLFDVRAGWCEHFASAFAFLMRAAGVPARVVIGFQGGAYNSGGDYYAIRRSDAHAWTEVWIAGEGWVRIDPTAAVAPERVSRDARQAFEAAPAWYPRSWLAELRDRVDLVGFWWNRAIIEFNAARQRDLVDGWGLDGKNLGQVVGLLVAAALLALALAAGLGGLRRTRDRDPLRAAFRAWCTRMGAAGLPRRPNEGPRDYGERLAAAWPDHADAVRSLIRGYVGLRYAVEGPVDASAVAAWRARARRVGPK